MVLPDELGSSEDCDTDVDLESNVSAISVIFMVPFSVIGKVMVESARPAVDMGCGADDVEGGQGDICEAQRGEYPAQRFRDVFPGRGFFSRSVIYGN